MAYFSSRLTGKRSVSAESLCLLVVVAAAVMSAYWAARTIGIDLSIVENAASAVGLGASAATTHQVGYSQARVEATPIPSAPYCQAGEQPAFLNGMAALHQQIGSAMGTPLECEHADGASGNTVQQTTAGLAAYDSQRNTETFTDGWHHWAWTRDGLVAWEGTSAGPPQADASADVAAVANQDGAASAAAAANQDDGASAAVAANQDDASSAAAVAADDGGPDDAVAANQDDAASDATVTTDDGAPDAAVAANQDDAASDAAVTTDDGASDDAVAVAQGDDSSAAAAASADDGSADGVTDTAGSDQP